MFCEAFIHHILATLHCVYVCVLFYLCDYIVAFFERFLVGYFFLRLHIHSVTHVHVEQLEADRR